MVRRPVVTPSPITPTAPSAQAPAPGRSGIDGMTLVRYLHSSPIRVHGQASGARYEFSADEPVVAVYRSDAPALVRTGYFRQSS